jgi:ornithine cyclodeaminase/alanine dehydrogenase-like protein (mu-crystallin family)
MRVVTAEEIDRTLSFPALIDALADAFRADIEVPVRHHHEIDTPGAATATNLLMPAWTRATTGNCLGVKVVNVFPDNGKRGLPSIHGTYLLMSGDTGETLAAMDGTRLTAWRTAAASALAARYLARADAAEMLMVGAGALAPFLVRAHAAVRPITRVTVWNRSEARAAQVVEDLGRMGITATPTTALEDAARTADIISCATLSREPLVRGAWLKPGAHLDLVGAYNTAMRESDDAAVERARIYVDTHAGALKEAGDIVQPLASGLITESDVEGDLFGLCRGTVTVQRQPGDITLFKSVGTAIEDLAAAMLVWRLINA